MIASNNERVSAVVENYVLSRDIGKGWARQIEHRFEQLTAWLGSDPPFSQLDCLTVNRWLKELQEQAISATTLHGYRTAIHAVWKFAYEESFTEIPPLRLRMIKRPQQLVRAYTHEDLRRLRLTAIGLPRNIEGTDIPRSLWWSAYIPTAYSTGLRRGCLLALEHSHIEADGRCVTYAKKTGKLTCRRLDGTALVAVAKLREVTGVSKLVFPMARARHVFFEDFKQLVARAGLPPESTSKWIRRSAISYAEAAQAGQGRALGGHSDERVTQRSYRDMSIAPPPVVEPPAVDWEAGVSR